MKKYNTIKLITFTSLCAIMVTLALSYLAAILLGIGTIKLSSLLMLFVIQSLVWYFSSVFVLRNFSKQFLIVKSMNKFLFGFIFVIVNFFLLLFFDYIFSTLTDFNFSSRYGIFLDSILTNSDEITSTDESFQVAPISLQNLAFNLVVIFLLFFRAIKIYCLPLVEKKN